MIANWQKPLSTDDHADVKITDQLPRDRDKIIALEALNGVLRDGAHHKGDGPMIELLPEFRNYSDFRQNSC
jgi:hypothetical protein